jgi:hypothetical protein
MQLLTDEQILQQAKEYAEKLWPSGKDYGSQEDLVYANMQRRANRLSYAEYRFGLKKHIKKGLSPRTYHHQPSQAVLDLCKASGELGRTVTLEQGMAMLHEYDTTKPLKI